jgi:hypothetical protein
MMTPLDRATCIAERIALSHGRAVKLQVKAAGVYELNCMDDWNRGDKLRHVGLRDACAWYLEVHLSAPDDLQATWAAVVEHAFAHGRMPALLTWNAPEQQFRVSLSALFVTDCNDWYDSPFYRADIPDAIWLRSVIVATYGIQKLTTRSRSRRLPELVAAP